MKCFVLFFITNIGVMLLFGVLMFFVKVPFSNLINLLILSGVVGFSGSIISLFISKYIALLSVNGKILDGKTQTENWLLKIVYNQSKKLGIVIPQVAIYEASDMNAFATGPCKNSALIAVSTGLLKGMNNDEIEAVVAHELSHVFNGDMVAMTLIQGVVNTFIIFISRILSYFISYCISFFASLSSSENDSDVNDSCHLKNSNSLVSFFISMILELIFGVLANIVVLWFSRRREFNADVGASELVGCDKMIAALEKLKLSSMPNKESIVASSFFIHGYCSHNISNVFSELFMSHPSLERRIKALCDRYYLK